VALDDRNHLVAVAQNEVVASKGLEGERQRPLGFTPALFESLRVRRRLRSGHRENFDERRQRVEPDLR
jgi:hypothetical protein